MSNKSTIPFWCVDEFLYWIMPYRLRSDWSSELMSRVSSFVDAYVLFEKIVLPERYKNEYVIKKLDPMGEIFEFVNSNYLINSDELTNILTIDLPLDIKNLESLKNDDYKWYSQHSGHMELEEFNNIFDDKSYISFAHLRLWQLSLVNEISENTDSTIILPISLQNIGNEPQNITPFQLQKIFELDKHFQQSIRSVSKIVGTPFSNFIENCPPLLSLLIDQSKSREHIVEVLIQFRIDFKELRSSAYEFESLIKQSNKLRDQTDIIKEWDNSWEILLKGDFRKPQLLKRHILLADVAKAIVRPNNSGISSILQSFLEYIEEKKAYRRFQMYSMLYNELECIKDSKEKLHNKFLINLVNTLDS